MKYLLTNTDDSIAIHITIPTSVSGFFFFSLRKLLGETPEHKFIKKGETATIVNPKTNEDYQENGELMVIYFSKVQIDKLIQNIEGHDQKDRIEFLLKDIKKLKSPNP